MILHFEYEMCLSNIFSAPHLLLVEVGGRGNVCAGAGGGGEAGCVVHHGVPRHAHSAPTPRKIGGHVVVGGRISTLLVLMTWENNKEVNQEI